MRFARSGYLCFAVLSLALLFLFSPSVSNRASAAEIKKPNIIWIWCDNLAHRDLGCYDSPTIRTPVIDQMARDGVRFTQHYIAHAVCSPSRAAMLTGRQPFRTGIVGVLRPDSPVGLPASEITLGNALRRQGYATMAIGKWHLGDRPEHLPTRRGFDGYFGIPYSMDMLPTILIRDEEIIDDLKGAKVQNITERYTQEAIRYMTANKDRPFFLYFSHTIPHPPINLAAKNRTEGRPIYEDAVEHVDQQTGVLLEALDKLGLAENTIVFFSSDNGPMSRGGDTGGLRGRISSCYEGGLRVPMVARWPGRFAKGRQVDEPTTALDIFPTLLHLAGGELAKDRPYDGQDILPLLAKGSTNDDFRRETPLYWSLGGKVRALREGKWKLHISYRGRTASKPELYDLDADRGEKQSLADKHPQIVERMLKRIEVLQKDIPTVWTVNYTVRDSDKQGGIRRE